MLLFDRIRQARTARPDRQANEGHVAPQDPLAMQAHPVLTGRLVSVASEDLRDRWDPLVLPAHRDPQAHKENEASKERLGRRALMVSNRRRR